MSSNSSSSSPSPTTSRSSCPRPRRSSSTPSWTRQLQERTSILRSGPQTKPGYLRHLTLPREVPKRTAPTALRNQRKHCMVSMLLSSVVRHNSVLGSSISYQITHICPCWDCMRRTTAWHHSIPSVSSWVFHSECFIPSVKFRLFLIDWWLWAFEL